MRILYDYQVMLEQKFGGVSRCFCELAMRLRKNGEKIRFIAWGSRNHYLEKYLGYKAIDIEQSLFKSEIKRWFIVYNQKVIVRLCNQNKVDILHSTWYDSYLLGIDNCKQVITVHDMIQEKMPGYVASGGIIELKHKLMQKADCIVAVSENTKKDILQIYPEIPADKIKVVYNGGYIEEVAEQCGCELPDKYILYVGVRKGYKNFENFISATKKVLEKHKDVSLVCVGGGAFTAKERRMLRGILDRTKQINASDKDLGYIYSHALEFVFPSEYEGFGIPIIEAFSCSCPVVLSNRSCFPEIAQDAAIYFNPSDISEMADKMEQFLIDAELKNVYVKRGLQRAKRFTWEQNAADMYEVYKKLLEE